MKEEEDGSCSREPKGPRLLLLEVEKASEQWEMSLGVGENGTSHSFSQLPRRRDLQSKDSDYSGTKSESPHLLGRRAALPRATVKAKGRQFIRARAKALH